MSDKDWECFPQILCKIAENYKNMKLPSEPDILYTRSGAEKIKWNDAKKQAYIDIAFSPHYSTGDGGGITLDIALSKRVILYGQEDD